MKYSVYSSLTGKQYLVSTKTEANKIYSRERKKLEKRTGFVHVKKADTFCVIKGALRDPRKKVQRIKPQCKW